MNLDDYRTTFIVGSLILSLVAASPVFSLVFPSSRGEAFSELWLLGPEHMIEGYPFNVETGILQGPIYVGVQNHMGSSQYYMIYVKFRNQTQPLPNATTSTPSPLSPLYEFQFLLADGEVWEEPLSFSIKDSSLNGNSLQVEILSINEMDFYVDATTVWDSEFDGFYFQLFFELWRLDVPTEGFEYINRFVALWLNATIS